MSTLSFFDIHGNEILQWKYKSNHSDNTGMEKKLNIFLTLHHKPLGQYFVTYFCAGH